MPVNEVPDVLLRVVGRYQAERRPKEPFHVWARRVPATELAATLHGAPAGQPMKRYRVHEEMNGIPEPPGKVWFWELEAGVIHADRCIECGTCVAVCPSNSIGVDPDTNLPELVKMCTGCSLCWDFCPAAACATRRCGPPRRRPRVRRPTWSRLRFAPTPPTPTGRSPGVHRGRSRCGRGELCCAGLGADDDVQDGGAVSALLIGLLAAGEIDGALVSKPSGDPDEQWKGVATIATTADQIRAASASFDNQTMALAELDLSRNKLPTQAPYRRRRDAV